MEVDWAWMVVVRFLQQSQLELAFRALLLLLDAADLHLIGIFIIIVLVAAGDLFFFSFLFLNPSLFLQKTLHEKRGDDNGTIVLIRNFCFIATLKDGRQQICIEPERNPFPLRHTLLQGHASTLLTLAIDQKDVFFPLHLKKLYVKKKKKQDHLFGHRGR